MPPLRKAHEPFSSSGKPAAGPAVSNGVLPPLADGFGRFLESPAISGAVTDAVAAELRRPREDPYDSHPPLAHRVAALDALPSSGRPRDDRPAIALLANVRDLERQILAFSLGRRKASALRAVEWSDLAEEVVIPRWRRVRDDSRRALEGVLADRLPTTRDELKDLGKRALAPRIAPSTDATVNHAIQVLSCSLATLLLDHGFTLQSDVGAPYACVRGETRIEPFAMLVRLRDGELPLDEWRRQCDALGIADLPLAGATGAV